LANPDDFVRCPYNPIDNPIEFQQWLDNVLTPALGDRASRVQDRNIRGTIEFDPVYGTSSYPAENAGLALQGQPEFFWFEWNGNKYPVPIINVGIDGVVTIAIALNNSDGDWGSYGFFQAVASGKRIRAINIPSLQSQDRPDFINQVVAAGFIGQPNDGGVYFGAGTVMWEGK
jgi:hypothetical protein